MRILENKYITVGVISLLSLIIVLLSGVSFYFYNNSSNCEMAPIALSNDEDTTIDEVEENISIFVEIKGGAYTDNINLSKKVSDELVIYVYTEDEMQDESSGKKTTSNFSSNTSSYNIETYTEGKVSIISSNDDDVIQENTSTLININTADATKLEELPGIGATKANSIIAYREEVGGFKSIEDLKNVSGIGDATFEKLKDYITV